MSESEIQAEKTTPAHSDIEPINCECCVPETRKILSEQLTRISNQRTAENAVLWVVFTIVSTANVQLVKEYMIASPCGSIPKSAFAGASISVIGLALTALFTIIFLRAIAHIDRLEKLSDNLQQRIGVEIFSYSKSVSAENFPDGFQWASCKYFQARVVARHIMMGWGLLFLAGFIWSIWPSA